MRRRWPPYAKDFLAGPLPAGLCIATGADAWQFAKCKPFPVLVLPADAEPSDFRWPSDPGGVVIFERGRADDGRLHALVSELLTAGSPFVVAIREAYLADDPRHIFYPGDNVDAVAA